MSGGDAAPYSNSATLRVDTGPLAAPAACRVLSMLATRAGVAIDRLDDALIVCDALVTHAPDNLLEDRMQIDLDIDRRNLRLLLRGLQSGGGRRIVASTTLPQVGSLLERLSEDVQVQPDGTGENLALCLALQSS